MKKITIRPFTASDIDAVAALQSAHTAIYPDAPIIPGELYLSPAFDGGQNVFCAIDGGGNLIGYAPLCAVLTREDSALPHTLWVEIKTDPGCESVNEIKNQLFEQILLASSPEMFPGILSISLFSTSSQRRQVSNMLFPKVVITRIVFSRCGAISRRKFHFFPLWKK